MATIKSFTDLEQSKTLAKILPIDSADMHSEAIEIDGDMVFVVVCGLGDKNKSNYGSPIWSLAALLSILPDKTCVYKKTYKNGRVKYQGIAKGIKELILKDNPIDACVTIIIHLNELNLL